MKSLTPRRGYLDVLDDDQKYKSLLGADIGNVSSPFYSVGQWIKLIVPGTIDSTALRAIERGK